MLLHFQLYSYTNISFKADTQNSYSSTAPHGLFSNFFGSQPFIQFQGSVCARFNLVWDLLD
nr:MAG TPA: hypothetical protein [Caudoviricetes sp.]